MTALGIALDMRALLAKGWTQADDELGALRARDEREKECGPLNPRARKWTLLGAVEKAGNSNTPNPASNAVWQALKAVTEAQPERWNNRAGRLHTEVLAALDAAIERIRRDA